LDHFRDRGMSLPFQRVGAIPGVVGGAAAADGFSPFVGPRHGLPNGGNAAISSSWESDMRRLRKEPRSPTAPISPSNMAPGPRSSIGASG
jgi:hypothetical protein